MSATKIGSIFTVCLMFFATVSLRGEAVHPVKMEILRVPGGARFGLIGEKRSHPAPTLFLFALSLERVQQQPVYSEIARPLLQHGFLIVMLDPPAHGEDVRADEREENRAQLWAWRYRLEKGEDFVGRFTTQASHTLDYLIAEGYADPDKIAACGISRGGFLAFHFAAADPRIKVVGGLSPVTDLLALTEFQATSQPEKAEALSVVTLAPKLAGRAVWVSIGNHDSRVGTDQAIAFTQAVVRASAVGKKNDAVIPVELLVVPSRGHGDASQREADRLNEALADWFVRQLGLGGK